MTPKSRGSASFARSDQSRAEPCGSASTTTTRLPWAAQAPATCSAKVVLPTPPFWLRNATITARLLGRSACKARAFYAAAFGLRQLANRERRKNPSFVCKTASLSLSGNCRIGGKLLIIPELTDRSQQRLLQRTDGAQSLANRMPNGAAAPAASPVFCGPVRNNRAESTK